MNMKQWLGRARFIDRELQALRDARRKTFEGLTNITQNYCSDGAQTTPNPHKLDRLIELNDMIDRKETELTVARLEIMTAIMKVPSGNQRAVLMAYFINGKTLENIGVENGYSARNAQNVRNRGVRWLAENMAEVP